MNARVIKTAIVLMITIAILDWMRGDRFDFDIRSIMPFMRGEITLYDWGGLALILLGLWGYGRLRSNGDGSETEPDDYEYEEVPEEDDQGH